jgi:hypothetical protein
MGKEHMKMERRGGKARGKGEEERVRRKRKG